MTRPRSGPPPPPPTTTTTTTQWSSSYTEGSTSPANPPLQPILQYTSLPPAPPPAPPVPPAPPLQPTPPASIHPPSPHNHHHPHLSQVITQQLVTDAFLQALDPSTISTMIQSFIITNPSPTPLTPIVQALFDAVSADSRDPYIHLRRYFDASSYLPNAIVHAGVSGPMAGPKALQMLIRKYSTWIPYPSPSSSSSPSPTTNPSPSLSHEMQRIATERQRKKDHIQWARIHAAALELGLMSVARVGDTDNSGYIYAMGRAFSEMMARDAVWENDEVEWAAGVCVLRAVIRTAMRGDRRQRDEYDQLLTTYEGRWKEIKDEARQALVAVTPLSLSLSAFDSLCVYLSGGPRRCQGRPVPHVGSRPDLRLWIYIYLCYPLSTLLSRYVLKWIRTRSITSCACFRSTNL